VDLDFSPDGKILVSASDDNTIIFWNVENWQLLCAPLPCPGGKVLANDFSPDGRMLASGCADGTILLWDVTRRQLLWSPLKVHTSSVLSVDFSSDGNTLASGSQDNTIQLLDLDVKSWKAKALRTAKRALSKEERERYLIDKPSEKYSLELQMPLL
jgi:WD40 repeat protein